MANTTFSRGSKVSKEWLQEVNDHIHSDTPVSGNTVHGSDVVSFVQSGSGASATTVQNELRGRSVNAVTQFGLSEAGTGSANRTALANAISAAGSKAVYIPAGTYSIDPSGGKITVGCKVYGDGKQKTILSVSGDGDLFQRGAHSVFQDMSIDMNGDTYSGHCMQFASGASSQEDRGIEIKNCAAGKQALLFDGDGGSQFFSSGSIYHTLSDAGSDAAIKFGTDTAARPRVFIGAESSGCTLFDLGACNDVMIFGGFTNGLLFSSDNAARALIASLRVGTVNGTVTIKGDNHKIKGCVFSDPVELASGSSNIDFDSEVNDYDITDNGTANLVRIPYAEYTPTWTAATSNPDLGNGTLVGTYSVEGRKVTVTISLTMGSTTTYGSGAFRLSLPFTARTAAGTVWTGTVRAFDNGTGHMTGACLVSSAGTYLEIYLDGAGAQASASVPITWTQGDRIDIQVSYIKA